MRRLADRLRDRALPTLRLLYIGLESDFCNADERRSHFSPHSDSSARLGQIARRATIIWYLKTSFALFDDIAPRIIAASHPRLC